MRRLLSVGTMQAFVTEKPVRATGCAGARSGGPAARPPRPRADTARRLARTRRWALARRPVFEMTRWPVFLSVFVHVAAIGTYLVWHVLAPTASAELRGFAATIAAPPATETEVQTEETEPPEVPGVEPVDVAPPELPTPEEAAVEVLPLEDPTLEPLPEPQIAVSDVIVVPLTVATRRTKHDPDPPPDPPPPRPVPPREVPRPAPRPAASYGIVELPRRLATNRPPAYPPNLRAAGVQGLVVLRVTIDATGAVSAVEVQSSSGYAELDAAAVRAVWDWRFTPYRRGGRAQAAVMPLPIRFRLNG